MTVSVFFIIIIIRDKRRGCVWQVASVPNQSIDDLFERGDTSVDSGDYRDRHHGAERQ